MAREFTILTSDAGRTHSGPGRFVVNLAKGLKDRGHSVSICSLHESDVARTAFEAMDITFRSASHARSSAVRLAFRLVPSPLAARRVAELAVSTQPDSLYIVLSDDLVDAGRYLPSSRSLLISQGDYALLFFQSSFFTDSAIPKGVLSAGGAAMILSHGKSARRYFLRAANSEFTRKLMSFLYDTQFEGVVYPPVVLETFRPPSSPVARKFPLAVVRNDHEDGTETLQAIAKQVPLTVVGGGRVEGARNLGYVSEADLVQAYAHASFLISPSFVEPFGYPVAEALACGTPALVLDAGGPAELVRHGENGWKATSVKELEAQAFDLYRTGIPDRMRSMARDSATLFSVPQACNRIESLLDAGGL